jgi:hypothetical protein
VEVEARVFLEPLFNLVFLVCGVVVHNAVYVKILCQVISFTGQ